MTTESRIFRGRKLQQHGNTWREVFRALKLYQFSNVLCSSNPEEGHQDDGSTKYHRHVIHGKASKAQQYTTKHSGQPRGYGSRTLATSTPQEFSQLPRQATSSGPIHSSELQPIDSNRPSRVQFDSIVGQTPLQGIRIDS